MHGHGGGDYKDLVVFLAAAGVIVPLVNRLKISPVLGFLPPGSSWGRTAWAGSPTPRPGCPGSPSATPPSWPSCLNWASPSCCS